MEIFLTFLGSPRLLGTELGVYIIIYSINYALVSIR